jgi:CheY-like chemotaxis protein
MHPLDTQKMKRVLVVDDERITADTLGLIFRKRGFESHVAYSVDDALTLIRQAPPELILCDITMPGRDGLELMVELTRMNSACPVIVLTGYITNLPPVQEQIRKMPQSTHVFLKPCAPEEILREAARMLAVAS